MCTNFVLIKKDGTAELAGRLGVNAAEFLYTRNAKPGAAISIVTGAAGERRVRAATWWLYLKASAAGMVPDSKWFSVNTNYRQLPKKAEYRRRRCIVPATAFVESQERKNPHLLTPADGSAIAFGGLWKEWPDPAGGGAAWSASIITLPGHPALANIHRKSTPLWLSPDDFDVWLDPALTDTTALDHLLTPALQTELIATPIDAAFTKAPVGEPFTIRG